MAECILLRQVDDLLVEIERRGWHSAVYLADMLRQDLVQQIAELTRCHDSEDYPIITAELFQLKPFS